LSSNFREFINDLENEGELHRVKVEVDPELEITEIAIRAQKENKPAILFENVKGSNYPLAINTFASDKRIEIALGQNPEEIGNELLNFIEALRPPKIKEIFKQRKTIKRFLAFPPKKMSNRLPNQIVENGLDELPVLKCWPEDGGKFITLPLVQTNDPVTNIPNLGMYRLHVYDKKSTGMHMQIGKGGGYHYQEAEKLNNNLPVAVTIGGDPVLTIASIMALPEGVGELEFAGLVRKKRTRLSKCKTINIKAPSTGEFLLEGYLKPFERKLEGPFGDHFGHYSEAGDYPIFHINNVYARKDAIYPATVVGKPPQEDKYLGDCTQSILKPLIKVIHPEVHDLWAYYEAGFHSFLVVSTENRYAREAYKTGLSILGLGQLSLTKVMILVDKKVNVKNRGEVLEQIRKNFDPIDSIMLISQAPTDTLDFTSKKTHHGNKLVINATTKSDDIKLVAPAIPGDLRAIDSRIIKWKVFKNALLVVNVEKDGSDVIKKIINNPLISNLKMVAVVSKDINLENDIEVMWGIFTRFDPGDDIYFENQEFIGAVPKYSGIMGIDATWKGGYQKTLEMDDAIINKVNEKWETYWK
jgi:4-hydroxy-3-polyprenylbenzoate decarboxylase